MAFFSKLKEILVALIIFPLKTFKYIQEKYVLAKTSFFSFIHHFKILRDANISLGKYHLMKGNFKDADWRFRITNKLFAPNDPENLYWNAWANILLKDYQAAISKLNNNSYDQIGLGEYITNMSSVWTIPDKIEAEYNSIAENFKLNRYFSDNTNLFISASSAIIPYLPQQSWNETQGEYTVLEIGTNPFWVNDLIKYLPEPYLIDGINFSAEVTKKTKTYNDKNYLYYQLLTTKHEELASELSKKYELIIALDSLSYTANLLDNFKSIKSLLTDDGLFIFALPKGEYTRLEPSANHFTYTQNYIAEQLKLAEFESSSITSIVINKNFEYFLVIAK